MPEHRKDHASFKTTLESFRQILDEALQAEEYSDVLEMIDSAPQRIKSDPEIMFIQANLLLSIGEFDEGLQVLREIERKDPSFWVVNLPLSLAYMERELPAHALQAAKRALSIHNLPEEEIETLNQLIKAATEMIQSNAAELGLPFHDMQRASMYYEQAQLAENEFKLSESDQLCREALKIAPNWNPPNYARAWYLFYLGRISEAIAISEAILSQNPDTVIALGSLVTFLYGANQPEKAREYADRMEKLAAEFPAESVEIETIITSLALVENTQALWQIAQRFLKVHKDDLDSRSWHCLAVAAVRSEHFKEALKLIRKADEEELSLTGKNFLHELKLVAKQGIPDLYWMPPTYPGADLLLHPKVVAEWDALSRNLNPKLHPSHQRKIDAFFQRYPFMVTAMKRLLWEQTGSSLALSILSQIGTPETEAEILRFALSDVGGRDARMNALFSLVQAGGYKGPKVIKLWHEDLKEWRDTRINTQQVGNVKPNAQPQTLALIEKAHQAHTLEEAIAFLRKAVNLEPTCPIALYNLGTSLTQSGQIEEGEALIFRSVEADPNYTFGHAMIALTEAEIMHEQTAIEHLDVVTNADIITPETAVIANLAWAALATNKADFKTARSHLDLAARINPENPLIGKFEDRLEMVQDNYEDDIYFQQYFLESAQRAHRKLLKTPLTSETGVQSCLEVYTRDMLVGCARFVKAPCSGNKGKLVNNLVAILFDSDTLYTLLYHRLQDEEREACEWLMDAGGVCLWDEFVSRYGDDSQETTEWSDYEPETLTGRLRLSGLLHSGTLDGRQVAFIPKDLRPLLREVFNAE